MKPLSDKTDYDLLGALKSGQPDFVSGEMLAEQLSMSRVSVKSRIDRLRENGFNIEAVRNRGYRLLSSPIALQPTALESALADREVSLGWELLDECVSTNDEAMRRLTDGIKSPLVVISRRQTKGRGRLGRQWHSEDDGNLMISFGFRPNREPAFMQRFTVFVGLRLASRISAETGLEVLAKWPNDLLLGGKKLAGILTEARLDADRMRELILGLGLNINSDVEHWPTEVRDVATSLAQAKGGALDMNDITALVVQEVSLAYEDYVHSGIEGELAALWERFSAIRNQSVTISAREGELVGTVLGLDSTGALQLKLESGEERSFAAGDVSIRKFNNK
ncbi:MAG: biotin--[acetyl-CoA-carboxylase] ligase [Puniceicoccales bacterium]